ncbi:MAG: hypothetical protein NTV80_14145 [Verrucomicrobia bacterium]|nr:hypothetical protein [Verrucomicrobiota bacterium]
MNDSDSLPPPSNEAPTPPPSYDPHAQAMDPERIAAWYRVHLGQQSLGGAIIGGLIGAVIGAAAWAAITIATQYQIGFMAIGVGVLVGKLVLKFGRGLQMQYGVIGAVFALLGCLVGNLATACWFISKEMHQTYAAVLSSLNLQSASEILTASFNGMDLLFYGFAIYEGYKLSFRQITESDLAELRGL